MLSQRRERFQRLIHQACALKTDDLAEWVTNEALSKHREFLLARLACLRIYASRVDDSGATYARRRDGARVRLGIPSPRLTRRSTEKVTAGADKRWEIADDLRLRGLFFAGHPLHWIAERMCRTQAEIELRLAHLQLIANEGSRHA